MYNLNAQHILKMVFASLFLMLTVVSLTSIEGRTIESSPRISKRSSEPVLEEPANEIPSEDAAIVGEEEDLKVADDHKTIEEKHLEVENEEPVVVPLLSAAPSEELARHDFTEEVVKNTETGIPEEAVVVVDASVDQNGVPTFKNEELTNSPKAPYWILRPAIPSDKPESRFLLTPILNFQFPGFNTPSSSSPSVTTASSISTTAPAVPTTAPAVPTTAPTVPTTTRAPIFPNVPIDINNLILTNTLTKIQVLLATLQAQFQLAVGG